MSNTAIELQKSVDEKDRKALWVFGYGSLCWKPGFFVKKAVLGCVKGLKRTLSQGSIKHRGTEGKVI